ncbi:MAG TPA: Fe2+-dependent dioxygenase [Rhizomicrobium sp.]|jgi:PKHD-type hydroxylase|nr:Fe2+-dependent dioxygenase [Rhizomicrobium sp.]
MLIRIPDVLNSEQVAHMRGVLEKSDWADGKLTAGALAQRAKANLQVPENSPTAKSLGEIVLAALGKNDMFTSAALAQRISPPQFNRYDVGMTYGNHIDNALRRSPFAMRTDLSATLFLTDPRSYDGGELVVLDTYGFHSVKLAAGDLILYSATSRHRVQPVTRGSRWSCFFWIQSMVRDEAARTMLFELDGAIQSIGKKVDAPDEILTLTGVYHNLFRRWADA